jgi:hypothetical protein
MINKFNDSAQFELRQEELSVAPFHSLKIHETRDLPFSSKSSTCSTAKSRQ